MCDGEVEAIPVDMEWVVSTSNQLYFVQMRPITTMAQDDVLWTRQFWVSGGIYLQLSGWSEIENVMNPYRLSSHT